MTGELFEVKALYQATGYGESKTVRVELRHLPEEETDYDTFLESHVEEFIESDGKTFKYHDSLKEHYVRDGIHHVVFYLRYCVDVEKENFATFLEDASPADLLHTPGDD